MASVELWFGEGYQDDLSPMVDELRRLYGINYDDPFEGLEGHDGAYESWYWAQGCITIPLDTHDRLALFGMRCALALRLVERNKEDAAMMTIVVKDEDRGYPGCLENRL